MKDEESQNMDMSAKPADISIQNKLEFEIDGQKVWMDWDEFNAQEKFMKEQEKKMWEYWAGFQKELHGDEPCWCQKDGETKGNVESGS